MSEYVAPGALRARAKAAARRAVTQPIPPEKWKRKDPLQSAKHSMEWQAKKWAEYDRRSAEAQAERAAAKAEKKRQEVEVETLGRARALSELVGDGTYLGLLDSLRVRLTPAQRVLCGVCFDGWQPADLDESDRELFCKIFGDLESVPEHLRRWLTWVIGGRSGKSYLGVLAIYWRGLVSDLSSLAPGEDATGLIVCPDLRLARHALKYIRGAIKLPQCASALKVVSDGADACIIERPDGKTVSFEALPATAGGGAVRARTLIAAMLDECAFFRDEDYSVNDRDIYDAVDPRVTIPGGFSLVSSTPWIESGLLHEEWVRDYGHPETGLCAHTTTSLMRQGDAMIEAAIARARIKSPKNAEREFDAVFGAVSSGLFFPVADAQSCTAAGQLVIPVATNAQVLIVADAAFSTESTDRFGWAVVSSMASPRQQAEGFEERRERRITTVHECGGWEVDRDPRAMAARLRDEVCVRYGVRRIVIDQYSDRAFAQLCGDVGLIADIVHWVGGEAEDSKAERYRRVRTAMLTRHLLLCDNPQLRQDLAACRSTLLPGGGERIAVPRTRRGHGDCLAAVVLGASEVIMRPTQIVPDESPEERAARQLEEQRRKYRAAAEKRARGYRTSWR